MEEKKLAILSKLIDAEVFETFIHKRYPGQKRFSIEGGETLIAAIHELVELAPELGVKEIVVGMAHRGRLNILANILDKSYRLIFDEFEDVSIESLIGGDGDVKYHKGYSSDHCNQHGNSVHLSLTANPSHLEAVNPVVEGIVRAKQRQIGDDNRKKVLPLLIHGDAAFSGQGLVAETLNLSQLKGYKTGGTVHFIINNQIGFTTNPADSRSYRYSTDLAKTVEAPIFHVNGDDPEATVFVTELALEFRQEFGRDVVIDMLCYRRYGHNEGDEPAFTQPLVYKQIKKRPTVRKMYRQSLLDCKVIAPEEADRLEENFHKKLQEHFEETGEVSTEHYAFTKLWSNLNNSYNHKTIDTTIDQNKLIKLTKALTSIPEGFQINPKIKRQFARRIEAANGNNTIDWAFGEALAFGSLLSEGTPVRLSGQDSIRGTFSHRHSLWLDMNTMQTYCPLNNIMEDQEKFCVYNSPLSEAGVLGFDYGYSLAEPNMLIMWEAQFGDFANGAQVIIDQFITSSQVKWKRTSGIVMLLPHGYEGQGPEHSNAYLERYLLACAQENIIVCSFTTPAQYFHALRRQIKQSYRKPLIVMSPKSLLRNKHNVSTREEFTHGCFQEIIDDTKGINKAKRLIFCTGKIYYELHEKREKEKIEDTAIVRIEQLYPFHEEKCQEIIAKYSSIEEVLWVQEETQNRGAWPYMYPWLRKLLPNIKLCYVGRNYAASPASGSSRVHQEEQERIISTAILEKDILPSTVNPETLKG